MVVHTYQTPLGSLYLSFHDNAEVFDLLWCFSSSVAYRWARGKGVCGIFTRDTLDNMTNSIKPVRQAIERPDDLLAGVAAEAWQAYNAMDTTKRRHYELLEILDNKKKNYNLEPSQREQALLASLLKDHDEQVKRFTAASVSLKQADADAHIALFVYIGAISETDPQTPLQH